MQVFKIVEANKVLTWRFYAERILPVGLFMALTLLFGNIVYLYLTVSFIQMLKASPPHIHCLWPGAAWASIIKHGGPKIRIRCQERSNSRQRRFAA